MCACRHQHLAHGILINKNIELYFTILQNLWHINKGYKTFLHVDHKHKRNSIVYSKLMNTVCAKVLICLVQAQP